MNKLIILLSITALAIFTFSCKEPEDHDTPPTIQQTLNTLSEYSIVNKLFADSFSEADDAAKDGDNQIDGNKNGTKDGYPIITITPFDATTWPKEIKVDYGTTDYTCPDGNKRRGIINIETTGFYRDPGTVIKVNFDNYYQNSYNLEGMQIVTNAGRNDEQHLVYNVEIISGIITTPQNKVISFQENTSREWVAGEETILDPCDDNYYITGTQSGVSSENISYALTVQNRLDILICCNYIRGGILNVQMQGLATIAVNFGDGTCDKNATVIINNTEYPIVMQ